MKIENNTYYDNPDNIVYVHNYQGLVMITRRADGRWFYNYSIKDVIDRLNEKPTNKYSYLKPSDTFDCGEIFGYKINKLLRKCRIEFGDSAEDEDDTIE